MLVGNPVQVGGFEPIGGVITFAVSLLIGGAAIHVAAKYAEYNGGAVELSFDHAVLTALAGAVVWALLAWIPLIGSVLALGGWIGVIKWRYPGGWIKAGVTGAAAWAAGVVVLAGLELIGVGSVTALGIPGT